MLLKKGQKVFKFKQQTIENWLIEKHKNLAQMKCHLPTIPFFAKNQIKNDKGDMNSKKKKIEWKMNKKMKENFFVYQ